PRGATVGSTFAVMDPSPCRCTLERGGNGSSSGGGVGSATNRGQGVYDPPLLWPLGGSKLAYSTGQGPVAHLLRLRSAYSQQADAWGTGEPAFTSYHHMFKGTVDYVFYGPGPLLETPSDVDGGGSSPDAPTSKEALSRPIAGKRSSLRCVGVSEPPLRRDLDHFGGLPSPEEPSDHVLLAVQFEITPPPSP
ncbi:unnamed protein product, partial [Laminaria digitata]